MYDVLNAYMENGLKLILHKLPGTKTISCGLWVKQGSSYETDEDNGLSHLTEHLLLNPENENSIRYRNLMQEASANGVIYNAATTKEYTCYYLTGLKHTLKWCLSALACVAMENREFTDDFFENEKKIVLQEARGFYSSFQQIKERTSQALWGNTGTGKIIMGDMSNITRASQNQVKKIIEDAYVPGNAAVVVVGNIEYPETMRMIEEQFAGWKDKKESTMEYAVEKEPGIYFNQSKGANVVFSVGFRAPSYSSEGRIASELMVNMIGQSGMQSRLSREIRMKRGLAYTLGGFSGFYRNRGSIGFMAVCDKEKITETAKVMMGVLRETRERGFTEEEVNRAKRTVETGLLLSVDNITDHLRNIGRCCVMEKDFFIEKEIREIRELEREEIEKVTTDILQEDNMALAVIGDCNAEELVEQIVLDRKEVFHE